MSQKSFTEHKTAIHSWVDVRQGIYRILARLTLLYVLIALWLWQFPISPAASSSNPLYNFFVHISQIVNYFVPETFEDFVNYFLLINPLFGVVSIAIVSVLIWYKKKSKKSHTILSRAFRDDVLENQPKVVHDEEKRVSKHSFAKAFNVLAHVISGFIVLALFANLGWISL